MADSTRLRDRITRDRLLLAAVLVVGIAGTGIVRRQLGVLGFNGLGRLVFIFGYGTTVFLVWYGWIRPLDITGPGGGRGMEPAGDEEPAGGPNEDATVDADAVTDADVDADPESTEDADVDADTDGVERTR